MLKPSSKLCKQLKLLLFTLIPTTIFCFTCDAQIGNFKKALENPKIGEVIEYKDDSSTSQIVFLGMIKDGRGEEVYYVLREFYRIQAAVVMHGHSRIVFLDKSKRLVAQYRVSIPQLLPKKLSKNILYFEFVNKKDNKKKKYKAPIDVGLPEYICVEPGDCYSKLDF